MNTMRVLGITGWSGSGKTTLLTRLIPVLVSRGLRVSTLKHAHHAFDVDQPGKDSYVHRAAGASEVIISSARRWVQMHETGAEGEASLEFLLRRLTPCDLVLIEGFKRERHWKLEVYRPALGKPALHVDDDRIVAVASDGAAMSSHLPWVGLDDIPAIADLVVARAQPLAEVLASLSPAA